VFLLGRDRHLLSCPASTRRRTTVAGGYRDGGSLEQSNRCSVEAVQEPEVAGSSGEVVVADDKPGVIVVVVAAAGVAAAEVVGEEMATWKSVASRPWNPGGSSASCNDCQELVKGQVRLLGQRCSEATRCGIVEACSFDLQVEVASS